MRLYGLGDATTDRLAKIKDLQDRIAALNAEMAVQLNIVNSGGYTVQSIEVTNARAAAKDAARVRINEIQLLINQLTLELNALLDTDAKVTNALASTPAAVANANMKAVNDYRQQLFFLAQAGYDYGKGSGRRNAEYKGLGDLLMTPQKTSHSLYNLYNQDGLSDIFADIVAGGKAAITNYKASGAVLPSLPSVSLPNIPGGPKLAGMKLPAWMQAIVPAALAGAKAAKGNKAAPVNTIATGGAAPLPYEAPAPNYLGWGLAAVAVGVAYKVVRGRR